MAGLFDWIANNADALNVIGQYLMILVWFVYLQLFVRSFALERRPRMLIHRGTDEGLDSLCLVANMGKAPMFVECMMVVVETSEGTLRQPIVEWSRHGAREGDTNLRDVTLEGPLESGSVMNLGTFRDLLRRAYGDPRDPGRTEERAWPEEVESIEIRVVATFGPSDQSMAGRRRFTLEDDVDAMPDRTRVRPLGLATERLSGWRSRPLVKRWLEECA